MAPAISQLVDTVRGSMLLNIVTFEYTEVYPANQMAESSDFGYTLIWRHITANIHVPHHANIEVISNIEHAHYSTYFRN